MACSVQLKVNVRLEARCVLRMEGTIWRNKSKVSASSLDNWSDPVETIQFSSVPEKHMAVINETVSSL